MKIDKCFANVTLKKKPNFLGDVGVKPHIT